MNTIPENIKEMTALLEKHNDFANKQHLISNLSKLNEKHIDEDDLAIYLQLAHALEKGNFAFPENMIEELIGEAHGFMSPEGGYCTTVEAVDLSIEVGFDNSNATKNEYGKTFCFVFPEYKNVEKVYAKNKEAAREFMDSLSYTDDLIMDRSVVIEEESFMKDGLQAVNNGDKIQHTDFITSGAHFAEEKDDDNNHIIGFIGNRNNMELFVTKDIPKTIRLILENSRNVSRATILSLNKIEAMGHRDAEKASINALEAEGGTIQEYLPYEPSDEQIRNAENSVTKILSDGITFKLERLDTYSYGQGLTAEDTPLSDPYRGYSEYIGIFVDKEGEDIDDLDDMGQYICIYSVAESAIEVAKNYGFTNAASIQKKSSLDDKDSSPSIVPKQ